MNTNAREFARNFARYRRIAATGEPVRISAPDGVFLLVRQGAGMTGAALLERAARLPAGRGFFPSKGLKRVERSLSLRQAPASPREDNRARAAF